MSEAEVAKALQDLTKAVQALTIASGAASSSQPPEASGWEVIPPDPVPEPSEAELPEAVIHLAKSRLSSKEPGAVSRTRRAFEAGNRASKSLASGDVYQALEPLIGHADCQWVVLRCGDKPPFRTQTRSDFRLLTQGCKNLVAEAFPSLCEVQVFCLGAQCDVPELQKWKKK